jgi:heat shock protein HslJ
MSTRRPIAVAAVVAALLLAVSGGVVAAHMSQAQSPASHRASSAASGQQTNPGMLPLSGTPQTPGATYQRWKLASFTFDGRPQTLVSPITAVFIFDSQDLQVLGHVCNGIGETYAWSQDHSRLTAQGAWMSQVYCAKPGLMALEASYLAALRQVTIYHRDQSGITLRDDASRYVLRFVPAS